MSEKRDWRGYIDVTNIDPRLLVQIAYSGSRPQGMGFLHHKPGGLDEETLNAIIERSKTDNDEIHLDYIHGRSMKFHIRCDRETKRKYLYAQWYDHGADAITRLLKEAGVENADTLCAKALKEIEEQNKEYDVKAKGTP